MQRDWSLGIVVFVGVNGRYQLLSILAILTDFKGVHRGPPFVV